MKKPVKINWRRAISLFSIFKLKRRESAVQIWSDTASSPIRQEGDSRLRISRLVSRVNRVSNLPRSEVERLVHKVFTAIMSGSREAANLGL